MDMITGCSRPLRNIRITTEAGSRSFEAQQTDQPALLVNDGPTPFGGASQRTPGEFRIEARIDSAPCERRQSKGREIIRRGLGT